MDNTAFGAVKAAQNTIQTALARDDVRAAVDEYRELDEMFDAVARARAAAAAQIEAKARAMNADIAILETPQPTRDMIQHLQDKRHDRVEAAPGVALRAVVLPTRDMVPDTPLYYIRDTDEFAFRVDGELITGRIGRVSREPVVPCRRNAVHDTAVCKWSHSPYDFSAGSFVYTRDALSRKTQHMRHVGNRDTLLEDIEQCTEGELTTRMRQTAHDLLVYLAMRDLSRCTARPAERN